MATQKNYFRVPPEVAAKLREIGARDLVVACVRNIGAKEIAEGHYSHLGMAMRKATLVIPDRILPRESAGRYSKYNRYGRIVVHRDRPKIITTYTVESPNYGDWTKGYHDVEFTREVYQRTFFPPKELEIKMEVLSEEESHRTRIFTVKFSVDEVLRSDEEDFDTDLLYAINLLQENVGGVDIFPSDASREDYIRTIRVSWEILPPGERDIVLARIIGTRRVDEAVRRRYQHRYDLLSRLAPEAWVHGQSGFRRYFGAKFSNDLVVFENVEHGNAIYVMGENWKTLTKLSRYELMSSRRQGFKRIVHRGRWERRVERLVQERRDA
jgi:hypothetical protein